MFNIFLINPFPKGARIAQLVQQMAMRWTTEAPKFESWKGQEYSLLHIVQTGSGFHSTPYRMGTGSLSLGVKQQGREADHSPPTSAKVKTMWIYTFTTPYAFMA
jgi:hypothetical protein